MPDWGEAGQEKLKKAKTMNVNVRVSSLLRQFTNWQEIVVVTRHTLSTVIASDSVLSIRFHCLIPRLTRD